MAFMMDEEKKQQILLYPHILGLLVGFKELTKLHSQWIRHIWCQSPGRHTALQAHRGGYKTSACTIIGIVWFLLWHPNARIALVRETYTEAEKTLKAIRRIMMHPAIQEIFRYVHGFYPKEIIGQDGAVEYNFKQTITKEPSVSAYGVLQLPTGSHFDFILLDDVVTLNDKISKAKREKTIYAVREILTNIIDPDKTVGHVGTPWHKKDAWTITKNFIKFPVYITKVFTDDQIAAKRKLSTDSDWAMNMELRHIADGEKPFASPRAWAPFPTDTGLVVAQLDSKYTGTDTCALTFEVKLGKFVHITGKIYFKHVMDELDSICENIKHYNAREIFIETNADKGMVASQLRAKLREKGIQCTVTDYTEKTNKHIKITGIGVPVWPYLIWDTNCDPEFLDQTVEYAEGNEPDDGPDSWTSLIREAYGEDNADWRFLYSDDDED